MDIVIKKRKGEDNHDEWQAGPRSEIPQRQGRWEKYAYRGEAGSREYFVYTPANYQIASAVPLLVMLHGCTEGAEDIAAVTQLNRLADQKQFIVVYPQQDRGDNQEQCWNWFESSDQSRGQWRTGDSCRKPFSDPQGPNASLAMYQFFLAHPLRELEVSARSIHLADESLWQYVALSGS